jgi:type IV pilus assembly protein PilY1
MRSIRLIVSIAAAGFAFASPALAQEPDVRDIPPFVMLVVDSSGSMEQLPACECLSATDCTNCDPDCSAANISGEPPKDVNGHEKKKNRWAVTLEALTGKFIDFQCTPLKRTVANGMTYDAGYTIDYHQPWKCASGTVCGYPGASIQQNDGILDSYAEQLKFGLLTFDGEATYKGGPNLLNSAAWSDSLSTSMPGMWSYGGKKAFKYPGCSDTYYVDTGVRSDAATEGGMISLNSTACGSATCTNYEINEAIQTALLKTRPYSGTPIAASLEDLYLHLKNDVSDSYKECRKKYAILITDGVPDPDFRDLRCDCGDENPMVACPEGKGEDFQCPYDLAEKYAKTLVAGDGSGLNPKQIEKLFVLGMSVQDKDAQMVLDKIADAGGTTKALQADDPSTLRSTLDSVFSPLLNPISRSVPGFASSPSGVQYQINTGFQVSSKSLVTGTAPPWVGLIERRAFVCNQTTGVIESPDIEDKDRLHLYINKQTDTRRLWTAVPSSGTVTAAQLKGPLWRGSDQLCGADYCKDPDIRDLADKAPELFVTDSDTAKKVAAWMYGDNGTAREGRRVGDIYHSSPTIVGPPADIAGDDAYTRFRQTAVVKERPLVMYVATNDGILHAISVEDFPVTGYPVTVHSGKTLREGQELWGFVPPMLMERLKDQISSHQFNFDGTPVVKDVFFSREGSVTSETEYHTVLITGMRKGGNGYVALDVTDPFDPKFLWQFVDPDGDMGLTYGQAEIVQATFKWQPSSSSSGGTVQTRAVAILPGGMGEKAPDGTCTFNRTVSMKQPNNLNYRTLHAEDINQYLDHRSAVQCWKRRGRALFFVDVETGQLIKKVFDDDKDPTNGIFLPSPIVGTPTAYLDSVGTTADRGFVMDADGVLWRIDMSSQDVDKDHAGKGWTMRPFHDLFWDKPVPYKASETTYERPVLTLDEQRRLVVLVGTGDTDNFEKKDADNRIVSLTEFIKTDPVTGPEDYMAKINWELRNENGSGNAYAMYPSEMVTGSMALFDGVLYAATFISNSGGTNSCEYGRGRLWSLDYIHPDPNWNIKQCDGCVAAPPYKGPTLIKPLAISSADNDNDKFNLTFDQAIPNMLVQGIGTTQRPACTPEDKDDPLNTYFSPTLPPLQETAPPAIWIVAQASGGTQRGGSRMGGIQGEAGRSPMFSRVTSWATSVD